MCTTMQPQHLNICLVLQYSACLSMKSSPVDTHILCLMGKQNSVTNRSWASFLGSCERQRERLQSRNNSSRQTARSPQGQQWDSQMILEFGTIKLTFLVLVINPPHILPSVLLSHTVMCRGKRKEKNRNTNVADSTKWVQRFSHNSTVQMS